MKEILPRICPSAAEKQKFRIVTASFLKKLNKELGDGKAILGGSGAKDTWLAGNHDIDIFVQYPFKAYADKSPLLSDFLQSALQKAFPAQSIERIHGSRDYFQLIYQNYRFEVVPILKISRPEQAKNITDVSPLHAQWVKKNAAHLKDEIRLAKQFCRAHSLYGAESYIQAFSGYVLEILVIYCGSFLNLLKAAQHWHDSLVIDVAQHYPKRDAQFHLNKSKLQSPLIVIDPVDKSRNAAAALSHEKFQQFKKIAKAYLRKPSPAFFEKEKITIRDLEKEATRLKKKLLFIKVSPLQGKEDVVGTKLLKVFSFLQKQLNVFGLYKSGWDWNEEAVFHFLLEKEKLPDFEIRAGPPVEMKEHVTEFKGQHRHTFIEKERIMAKVPVAYPQLQDFVKHVLQNKYVKERIRKVQEVIIK